MKSDLVGKITLKTKDVVICHDNDNGNHGYGSDLTTTNVVFCRTSTGYLIYRYQSLGTQLQKTTIFQKAKTVTRRCSAKNTWLESFFDKVADWRSVTLSKKVSDTVAFRRTLLNISEHLLFKTPPDDCF